MKCEPYEKSSIRLMRLWTEAAKKLNVAAIVLREVFLSRWWRCMEREDFFRYITNPGNDQKLFNSVVEECAKISWSPEEIDAKTKDWLRVLDEHQDSDIVHYRLKCLIEVGDEWLCEESKTYTFSEKQYLTAGKRYRIEALTDQGGFEFGFQSTTDLKGERHWESVFGCRSIWRGGKEIWNWYQAYLEVFMESNPDHPEMQELIKHCTAEAAKLRGDNGTSRSQ